MLELLFAVLVLLVPLLAALVVVGLLLPLFAALVVVGLLLPWFAALVVVGLLVPLSTVLVVGLLLPLSTLSVKRNPGSDSSLQSNDTTHGVLPAATKALRANKTKVV